MVENSHSQPGCHFNFSEAKFYSIINHFFFPRKLPFAQENDIDLIEMDLLASTMDVIEEFKQNLPGFSYTLFKNWINSENSKLNSVKFISDSIQCMERGEMLAFYLKAQNCGVMLYRPLDEDHIVVFSTFKASMANELVVSSPSDIIASFPQQSIKIPFSKLLKSKTFAQKLLDLNWNKLEMDLAMPSSLSRNGNHPFTKNQDVSETFYVSEWLVASLSDKNSLPCTEFPTIVKKIRDDVIWENAEIPFRRSGLWMTIKVVLQLHLVMKMGAVNGKLMYKLLMVSMMTRMCSYWRRLSSINIDLALQMLAKLGRRLEKLKHLEKGDENNYLLPIYENISGRASKTILDVRKLMDIKFQRIYDNEERKFAPLQRLRFDKDIELEVETLQKYLSKRQEKEDKKEKEDKDETGNTRSKPIHLRLRQSTFPFVDLLNQLKVRDEIETGFVLADVENWIYAELENPNVSASADDIRQLAIEYSTTAKSYYKNDPLGSSRMLLALLKIIYVVDKMAVEKYPMLKEHKCGLSPNIFHELLLRERVELTSFSEIESYFCERDKNARFPSLIEEDEVTINSFGARYAFQNPEMIELTTKILENTEKAINSKYEELKTARKKLAERRRSECHQIPHSHNTTSSRYINKTKRYQHCKRCEKESEIDDDVRVEVYERPLRDEPHCQNAVVFELMIPVEIACLRDLLHLFVFDFCIKWCKRIKIKKTWTDIQEVNLKSKWQKRVHLGSTTYYGVNKFHPDEPDDKFIVNCGYNCTFYGPGNTSVTRNMNNDSIKRLCTFKVQPGSLYRKMNWALKQTKQFSNDSLAKQSACHKDLTLSEYVEFGSLRSGHRLQIRNIYRALVTESLSFKNPSVVSLILQSLWEAGPNADNTKWYRESHEDLTEPIFTAKMVEEMKCFVRSQQKNWKEPQNLLIVILITVRILELNSTSKVIDDALGLLAECRNITQEWISKIEEVISKCNLGKDKSISNNVNIIIKDINELRSTLIDVAICCALTFSLNSKSDSFSKVLNASTMSAWMTSVVKIDNNRNISAEHFNSNIRQRNFLRLVRYVGISIENSLTTLIKENCCELNNFVKLQWTGADNGNFDPWKFEDSPAEQVCFTQLLDSSQNSYWIQVDLILGKFLVDGKPVSRLPDDILHHHQYTRIFGSSLFEVQPAEDKFCSTSKYNDCSYFFSIYEENLIVEEQSNLAETYELIPHDKLANEFPFLLVENFSHWWQEEKNIINFRPRSFHDDLFSSPKGIEYIFDIKSKRLTECKSSRYVVDITKDSFKKMSLFLSRIELSEYILTLVTKSENGSVSKTEVELPRLAMQFQLNESGELVSREFKDMKISLTQNLEVFLGLNSGLILEDCFDSAANNKIFVIPHGNLKCSVNNEHQNVKVNLHLLRDPPFFVYEVDTSFRYLKAGQNYSAWFYLAHLHAVTSCPLPDPFTGMTGTERAIQILQSGYCWSSEPFDQETIKTMEAIYKLSPARTFYPSYLRKMQMINWPASVSSSAAHEAYSLIINRLMEDSKRLKFLHSNDQNDEDKNNEKDKTTKNDTLHLSEKAYLRHLPYSPNAALTENFQSILRLKSEKCSQFINSKYDEKSMKNARTLACLGNSWKYIVPENSYDILVQRLISEESLKGVSSRGFQENDLDSWINLDFRNKWLDLYNFARNVSSLHKEPKWTFLLSMLAYRKIPVDELQILHAIAVNPNSFADKNPPSEKSYNYPNQQTFDFSRIKSRFRRDSMSEKDFLLKTFNNDQQAYQNCIEDDPERIKDLKIEYRNKLFSESTAFATEVQNMWPCNSCNSSNFRTKVHLINWDAAIKKVNQLLKRWYANRELGKFLQDICSKLNELRLTQSGRNRLPLHDWDSPISELAIHDKYEINYMEKLSHQFEEGQQLQLAKEIFESKKPNVYHNSHTSEEFWATLENGIVEKDENYLVQAGLYPRTVPCRILPLILQKSTMGGNMDRLINLVGCFGTLLSLEKQSTRIEKFKKGGRRFEVALQNEMQALSNVEWSRAVYPSWLLIELEMDITIRMIQIKVANQMITSENHSVLQLNMGEGKTAVIVPLLASLLANGQQLCRITVLKSLYRTNLSALRQCLGGMLNRRIYTVPCRRDRKINVVEANRILESYKECFKNKGIVMTLPEYRLSFQLKMYETARQGKFETSRILMEAHNWLNLNTRDILDESDEILHAKYQLIYTVGEQLSPGGGTLRWTIIQDLLKLVPFEMEKLWAKHGDQNVQFDEKFSSKNGPQIFWPCRLLSEEVYLELIEILAEKFLAGDTNIQLHQLVGEKREIIKRFLIRTDITRDEHAEATKMLEENIILRDTVLILAGYLKFEVLYLVLKKRWRVNYGVNSKCHRQMAVPFKAKDVANEMTEFGHPDVAICLTHLSYYYSGLSDDQLLQTFELLEKLPNADTEYENWINKVPSNDVHISISTYSGINLKDSSQRELYLFPILKKNMYVIDFWLNHVVFPREAKQFAGKMMCTAWDLVSEDQQKTVTGFSGTNDSKLLLPLPIQQRDLPELEKTNEEVRDIILRAENNNYLALEPNVKSISILKKLSRRNIQVLLDPGALMLELNNYQVALEWLKIVQKKHPHGDIKAAVYFDSRNVLMVTDGLNSPRELELSPFKESLDKCVTYLDDVHTRGTDLKFPPGIKACVTLAGDITRDKTVQACMRMRMLGKGHSIRFWASQEADNKIRKFSGKSDSQRITNKNVVNWICKNSRDFEEEGLAHWSVAGYNYTQKRAAHKQLLGNCSDKGMAKLSERCSNKEIFDLVDIYGAFKNEEKLTTIIKTRFGDISAETFDATEREMIDSTLESIVARVEEYIPDKKRFIQLMDEEQEKELENETEEERQVCRPGNATPNFPKIDPRVMNMIESGYSIINPLILNKSCVKLPFVLQNTSMWNIAQSDGWGNHIFATHDFMSVIKPEAKHDKVDEFLRPVSWIANVRSSSGDSSKQNILIMLSPFEANEFIPIFQASKFSTLHMFAPRLHPKHDNLLNTHQLQIPVGEGTNRNFVDGYQESQLSVFSGTLYFHNKREQDDYCNFAGLVPRPRSAIHHQAYENGQISSIGFLYPEFRSNVSQEINQFCGFRKCPDELIRRLAEQRHNLFPKTCHVASVVVESKKPFREN